MTSYQAPCLLEAKAGCSWRDGDVGRRRQKLLRNSTRIRSLARFRARTEHEVAAVNAIDRCSSLTSNFNQNYQCGNTLISGSCNSMVIIKLKQIYTCDFLVPSISRRTFGCTSTGYVLSWKAELFASHHHESLPDSFIPFRNRHLCLSSFDEAATSVLYDQILLQDHRLTTAVLQGHSHSPDELISEPIVLLDLLQPARVFRIDQ